MRGYMKNIDIEKIKNILVKIWDRITDIWIIFTFLMAFIFAMAIAYMDHKTGIIVLVGAIIVDFLPDIFDLLKKLFKNRRNSIDKSN